MSTSRVVSVTPAPETGETVLLDGLPHVVLHRLPKLPGRRPAVRVTAGLPCGICAAPLAYDEARHGWRCPSCRTGYDRAALAALAREHVADGVRGEWTRRSRGTRTRQVARGALGAGALLLSAGRDGGAPSPAERRALRWVLRDDGERPLSAERCREAADELATMTSTEALE